MLGPGDKYSSNMTAPWFPVSNAGYNFIVDPPSNSREMRNRAEKMRRDKLNSYIGELAQLVPMIAKSAKRMDKTSILRLTATHLRIYQTLLNKKHEPQVLIPREVDQYTLEQMVSQQLGGFLLILTPMGKIVFISQTVENMLGHLQTDLMGHTIYNITAPEDQEKLRLFISPDGLTDPEWRKYFTVRLKKAGPRTEPPVYEQCSIVGIQRNIGGNQSEDASGSPGTSTSLPTEILVFFVRIVKPEPLADRLIEASRDEYVTRHLVDGRIINCDQRISYIAGYMSEEVSGLSAFNFMHREDVRWVMIALRQMYDRGESRGSSCYRLLSRTGQFIYLRTVGFLEVDSYGVVESFVCINTLISEKEAKRLIKEMKERYSAIIKSGSCSHFVPIEDSKSSRPAESVEDPSEIEAAVAYLISSPSSDHRSTPSPGINTSESQDCTGKTDFNSYSHNPPLHLKVKPPMKRPLSDYRPIGKRRRSSPEKSTIPAVSPPYNRPKITEISW